jgi:integrase
VSGLDAAHAIWLTRDQRLADVLLVMAWTGVLWGEARALTVDDVVTVPTPALLVRRSAPEGVGTKATKRRHSRRVPVASRVPVANRVLPQVHEMARGKEPGDLLLTTTKGAQLHRSAALRALDWPTTGHGRRLDDLRHTAACLWLARGVDPGTVQAWMGHESVATTNRYLHLWVRRRTSPDSSDSTRRGGTPGIRAPNGDWPGGLRRATWATFPQVSGGLIWWS